MAVMIKRIVEIIANNGAFATAQDIALSIALAIASLLRIAK